MVQDDDHKGGLYCIRGLARRVCPCLTDPQNGHAFLLKKSTQNGIITRSKKDEPPVSDFCGSWCARFGKDVLCFRLPWRGPSYGHDGQGLPSTRLVTGCCRPPGSTKTRGPNNSQEVFPFGSSWKRSLKKEDSSWKPNGVPFGSSWKPPKKTRVPSSKKQGLSLSDVA